ncbi:MAG: ATP-dependent helicase [Acidobacteria bacterium]|nr:MAG: ATP-dependent helicase [Acidobacteriota bacterium]
MYNLNPEQRKAVEHGEGPLLVIAGPGSGKTRVITQRIVYLLEEVRGLQPENILALTFTDKAAGEMKSRVDHDLPGLNTSPQISTFHSFCYSVLRSRHFERKLLDKIDIWIFLRRRMEQLGLEYYRKLAAPGAFLHDLNNFFSQCQDELVGPDEFDAYVRKRWSGLETRVALLGASELVIQEEELRKQQELARVFRTSRRLIEEAGYSSLGTLISEVVHLWDREPEILQKYRRQFRYILVDEFQDSNYGQVQLLKRLVAPPYNITAVGDPDQAIYRFRGAAHGTFEMFRQVFPAPEKVYLNRNYRSTRRILRASDAVIVCNEQRDGEKPPLVTENPEGAKIFLLSSPNYTLEADGIVDLVQDLTQGKRSFMEIAILYRAHSHRDLLVREFRRRKIPFVIRGLSLLSTTIMRDLLAYLRLVHSVHDNVSLTRVLLARRWSFPETLSSDLRKQAARNRCSIYDAIRQTGESLLKTDLQTTRWQELKSILGKLRSIAENVRLPSLLDQMTELLELKFIPDSNDAACLEAFKKFVSEWEEKSETGKLPEFMEYFDYFLEAGGKIVAPEPPAPANAVQVMTVHASKGLEFPVVFILSVAPRRFPHGEQKPVIEFPDELRRGPVPPVNLHLAEERRLFYVAMTRARDQLYVSNVSAKGKKPSIFIDNLLSDPVVEGQDVARIDFEQVTGKPEATEKKEPAKQHSQKAPQSGRRSQPTLFGEPAPAPDTVRPPIKEWAQAVPAAFSDGKLRLSATAIETYFECPLKFKFSHLYHIPTGPQAALTFGNVMHQSVRHYFKLRKNGEVDFDELSQFYLGSWKTVGFEDSYQEETYRKSGLSQLREFTVRHNAIPIAAESVRMEVHFELPMEGVVLEGRIDQINPLEPRDSRLVQLVDYKTGRPRSQKDADKSLQLSAYALAARNQMGLEPEGLIFYNLTNNEPVASVRTEKELEAVQQKILAVAEEIRRMIFPPTPGFACRYCEFVPICPAHEEEL